MNNSISSLIQKTNYDFTDLTVKLQLCIAEVLPTSTEIPPKYLKYITYIINTIESIRNEINKNLSSIMTSPSTKALNLSDDEMKLWIKNMEEKERIVILPDVSHIEYSDFINNLDSCLSTWKSWGWKVPDFYVDIDYNDLLNSIISNTDIPKSSLTVNNLLYWLLIQWNKTKPTTNEIINFADIVVRTYFYKLIDEYKVSHKLIFAIKQTYTDIYDLIKIIPEEYNFNLILEEKILNYIIYTLNIILETADNTLNFNAIADFEKIWNESYPSTKLVLSNVISKRICSLYILRIKKAFEDLLVEIDHDKLHNNLLYLLRTSLKTMYIFDKNHYIIRLLYIYQSNWKILLEKACTDKKWNEKIKLLDDHWILYNQMIEILINSSYMVKQSLKSISFFQEFEKYCLEDSSEWNILITIITPSSLYNTIETWSNDIITKRYIKRFLRFYINKVLDPLLHTKRDHILETTFENIVNIRNELSNIDDHEHWISLLDVFINNLSDYIYKTSNKQTMFDNAINIVGGLSKTILRK